MNYAEYNRVVKLFEVKRDYTGLEMYRLSVKLDLDDWRIIQSSDPDWFYRSKTFRLQMIKRYVRQKYG